jgi:hypothetical protein
MGSMVFSLMLLPPPCSAYLHWSTCEVIRFKQFEDGYKLCEYIFPWGFTGTDEDQGSNETFIVVQCTRKSVDGGPVFLTSVLFIVA